MPVGKDYRIGLIAGLVLAVVALIWVATWDSLSPSQRLARSTPTAAPSPEPNDPAGPPSTPGGQEREPTAPAGPDANAVARLPSPAGPNVPDLTVYEKPEPIVTTRFHIVRKNETLSAISKQYYGTAHQWQKILEANRDTISDANKISPGTKLIIPD
jgi:nucleoid-associated protein YgaU